MVLYDIAYIFSPLLGSLGRIHHARNMAAPTSRTGLLTRSTASGMGITRPKLEMNAQQSPQVF